MITAESFVALEETEHLQQGISFMNFVEWRGVASENGFGRVLWFDVSLVLAVWKKIKNLRGDYKPTTCSLHGVRLKEKGIHPLVPANEPSLLFART
jgi:hypothetical protein